MINIKQKHLDELKGIFERYCPDAEIWAYGSRVNSSSHDGSDLDLTVKDFGNSEKDLSELKQLLSDSNIPFLIDINEFCRLPEYMQESIKKSYERIF